MKKDKALVPCRIEKNQYLKISMQMPFWIHSFFWTTLYVLIPLNLAEHYLMGTYENDNRNQYFKTDKI